VSFYRCFYKACEIGRRIVEACAHVRAGGEPVGVSAGLAYSPPERDMRVRELIEAADQAMYVAKALGGRRLEMAETDGA